MHLGLFLDVKLSDPAACHEPGLRSGHVMMPTKLLEKSAATQAMVADLCSVKTVMP